MRDISERVGAEEKLRQSELKYRRLHESMMDAFVCVDMSGRIQEFNQVYQQMLGYPAVELHELTYEQITPRRWHDFEAHILQTQVLPRGYSDVYEKEYCRKDGTVFPVELRSYLLRDETGEPSALWAIVRDITERKRANEALREGEERFRALAETALVGIYILLDGKYAYVNPAMASVFGYSVAEMTGMSPREIVQPCDYGMVGENIRRRISGEVQAIRYEVRGRHKDGSTRDVEVYGSRVEIKGRPALVGTLVDITERKRANEALRESEERFRQVAETVSDFVWEVDADGLYTFTSPSVEKILGYTPGELVGKMHFYDLFVPEVREQLKTAALEAFRARQRFQAFPNSNLSKSGRIIYLETSGVPILDETGGLLGYRGADTDVTDRRRGEMETQRLRQELARFSRIATAGELTASIAHELNQPLAAILSNAQAALCLMQREAPDMRELQEIFNDIVADDQRAAEVIRSLRSMLKSGDSERQLLSLNSLITDVVPIVRNEAVMKKVSVVLDLGSPMPPVEGNRIQLQQVILNLVVNAFDAMEALEQPRELVLRTRRRDEEIMLDVVDSGSGIPADKLKSIFESFYTTKPNGMGMGLSIARTIIEAHQGRIWAENDPSGGAAFRIALPASGKGEVASQQN